MSMAAADLILIFAIFIFIPVNGQLQQMASDKKCSNRTSKYNHNIMLRPEFYSSPPVKYSSGNRIKESKLNIECKHKNQMTFHHEPTKVHEEI